MSTANTVMLKIYTQIRQEDQANGTITPGMLLQRQSTGRVAQHANAGQACQKMFAIENDLQGKGISDNYADGDRVQYIIVRSGDRINALLEDGETIVIGDWLVSAASGKLAKRTLNSAGEEDIANIVGVAREAVDMSGSSGADPSNRIDVEII